MSRQICVALLVAVWNVREVKAEHKRMEVVNVFLKWYI